MKELQDRHTVDYAIPSNPGIRGLRDDGGDDGLMSTHSTLGLRVIKRRRSVAGGGGPPCDPIMRLTVLVYVVVVMASDGSNPFNNSTDDVILFGMH